MRPDSVLIEHPTLGKAVIRDQKAIMNDRRLEKALDGSIKTAEFHRLLNSMVFFWVSPDRLKTLREAAAYYHEPQLVLTLNTKRLLSVYAGQMKLCSMNSGSCKPMAHPRTPDIFKSIHEYDFEYWRKKKGSAAKAVVECTVTPGILDVGKFILAHEIVGGRS